MSIIPYFLPAAFTTWCWVRTEVRTSITCPYAYVRVPQQKVFCFLFFFWYARTLFFCCCRISLELRHERAFPALLGHKLLGISMRYFLRQSNYLEIVWDMFCSINSRHCEYCCPNWKWLVPPKRRTAALKPLDLFCKYLDCCCRETWKSSPVQKWNFR